MEPDKSSKGSKEYDENQKGENMNDESESHLNIVPEGEASEVDHQKAALEAAKRAEQEILYVRAEFDNYKKRLLKEQDQAIKMANRNFVTELLSVLDLFEHAVAHSEKLKEKDDKDVTNFVTGIEMTRSELVQMMQRLGVELVGSPGETFDPAKHEAISEVTAEGKEPHTVLSVVQKGCILHGKLLKPARVVLVKAN